MNNGGFLLRRGNFNWDDTRSLQPLHPLYLGVDSSNLAGKLFALPISDQLTSAEFDKGKFCAE